MLALAALCVVFGIWGLYDYYVSIPRRQMLAHRFQMLDQVRSIFEMTPTDEGYDQMLTDAKASVQTEIDQLVERTIEVAPASADLTPEQTQQLVRALQENKQEQQMVAALGLFQTALNQQRTREGVLSNEQMLANRIAVDTLAGMETVTPPSAFDRAFQWVYILCLPFAPFLVWRWWSKHTRRYELDDDGVLHLPGDKKWSREDVADIDMNRWMDKSIAYVVHQDGSRVELDDYYYQNMHLIVGHYAHGFYPEQWHEDARQVRDEAPEEADSTGREPHAEAAGSDDDPPRIPMA